MNDWFNRRSAPKPKTRYATGLEPAHMEATFAGGTRVQLCLEQASRWCMGGTNGGLWKRRKDLLKAPLFLM